MSKLQRLRYWVYRGWFADISRDREETAEFKGWCHAIDAIRGSLQTYPNGGGDIGIMREVDRLISEATDGGLYKELIDILQRHCGERGESEGAVETLQRIILERECNHHEMLQVHDLLLAHYRSAGKDD